MSGFEFKMRFGPKGPQIYALKTGQSKPFATMCAGLWAVSLEPDLFLRAEKPTFAAPFFELKEF
jgi:hypothetical protein